MLCNIASDFIPRPNNFFGILATLLEFSYSVLLHKSPRLIRHSNPDSPLPSFCSMFLTQTPTSSPSLFYYAPSSGFVKRTFVMLSPTCPAFPVALKPLLDVTLRVYSLKISYQKRENKREVFWKWIKKSSSC